MESSLFTNTIHVDFDSVLAMDNPGMVAMFQSLVASGLTGFLGCPVVLYEDSVTQFFQNGSVRDGLVVSTVNGVKVEISETMFAETFELPIEGLTELSEIPKDVVFDAKSIVSLSGEPVSTSGKKKAMKLEFRLLCDIMAKTISVKAGSFDSLTQEMFQMITAVTCGVKFNWSIVLFNILKNMITSSSAVSQNIPLVADTEFGAQRIPMELDQRPFLSSISDAPDMHFDETDIAAIVPSLPAITTDLSDSLDDLQTFLSERINESQSDILSKGGNDKKGEGSSRGPQPPPDDHNRGSGNTGGGGDNVETTSIVERLIDADRRRERSSEGRSRGNRSGSYKRRRYFQ
ncbi:hypothetical protein F511_10709 [Dorcoceras hygrometricum]|uniref:Dystroglycan-like n=1 Tax=Dorcoceras hygrometricum TaxID=472368 RepID=A0A2Z7A9H7_9LAMI|nr:hypothetical protein F511_10709 [Dorcoceras hygrometricum]